MCHGVRLALRLLHPQYLDGIWTGQTPYRVRYNPLTRNLKSWFSPITVRGFERPSKIALLSSLDYGLALILGISQKGLTTQEKSIFLDG